MKIDQRCQTGRHDSTGGRLNPVARLKLNLLGAALLGAGLLLAVPLYSPPVQAQNLPTLGDTSREDLSPLAERKLGMQIMSVVRRDPDYIDDGPVSEYLNRLGNKLLDAHPDARGEAAYDFEFFAVRDPELNAFAFPGGFIGFHTALILTAQTESELASVMGHEIGHVAQRHIARMLTSQKYDALIPLAALALAVLASRSSPDAAMAVAMGGQGLAIQKQLNFSRDAEREADRVGLQILRDGGFDPNGMVNFFGRLQASMRNYTDNAPEFLRSHPLTSARIADIQSRTLQMPYRQYVDSLEFFLARSRVRVLQDATVQGLIDAKKFFENQLKQPREEDRIAALYGLAFVAYKQKDYPAAAAKLADTRSEMNKLPAQLNMLNYSCMLSYLKVEILMAEHADQQAVAEADKAMAQLPLSRASVYQYAEALLAAGQEQKAEQFLRDQAVLYRQDAKIQNLLAKVYAQQGKQALQHIALAQGFAIGGEWSAAMQQLDIARTEKDAKYYEMSVIDAFTREWKQSYQDELAEAKRKKLNQSLTVEAGVARPDQPTPGGALMKPFGMKNE